MQKIITPKEKAIEIYNKFRNENAVLSANVRAIKQSIICVNEVIDVLSQYSGMHDQEFLDADKYFYQEVVIEIKNLK